MYAVVLFFCVSFSFANVSPNSAESDVAKTKKLPLVEALITSLEEWRTDDEACLRATRELLEGVRNHTIWATWVWDSMQLPAGSMYGLSSHAGNYDQCLQTWSSDQHPGFCSQYCLVRVEGPAEKMFEELGPEADVADYYTTPTKDGRRFNQYTFGACLPAVCSSSSVAEISGRLLRLTHSPPGDTLVDPWDCVVAGEEKHYPAGFYLFWTVVAVLFLTTVISTLIPSYTAKHPILTTIQESFCVRRNYRALFASSPGDLTSLHGLRALTAVNVVLIHESFVTILGPIINGLHLNHVLRTWGLAVIHGEVIVDTFFTMSGLLLVRGLMEGRQKNVLLVLLKRYIRLTGPFALCIFYFATTMEHMVDGPMWRPLIRLETEVCKQYWWKSLLMVNTDISTICPSVTWYISCDYQLAVLGALLVLLARRSRSLGGAAGVAVAAAVTANLASHVYSGQLDVLPFSYKSIIEKRNATYLNYTYLSSPARAGPYLVGLAMGYVITSYKPVHYKQYINKKWSLAIATISLAVICAVLNLGVILAGRPYDALEAAVLTATNRTLWGLAICGLIAICEYGSLKSIPGFLSWPGFVPLSKLSYCLYLVHMMVFYSQKGLQRGAVTYTLLNTLINGTGVLVLACALSLVMHLTCEAPVINISNAMFSEKSKLAQNDSTAEVKNYKTKEDSKKAVPRNGTKAVLHNGTKSVSHDETKEVSHNGTKEVSHNETKENFAY